MTVIVTKNSSTASAVPTTSDLVQGELAVNVTDKRLFTENASTQIVELGTNPSTVTTTTATVSGTLTANGTFASSNAVVTGGSINSTPIGATTASTVRGSTVTATTGFVGGLTGDVVGNVTGNVTGNITGVVTGNVTGNVTGDVTGNITASSGTSTFTNVTINGGLDMNAGTSATITNLASPTNTNDAATKGYVDTADATKLNLSGGTMSGAIAMGAAKITGLADPTAAQDAATKIYVDNSVQGLDAKASCRAGTTANITLSGAQTIDGVSVIAGDRVLVKDQTSAAENGIYVAAASGWARSADANTWDELVNAYSFVEDGTANANNGFVASIVAGGTLGSTAVTWVQFSGAGQVTAGAGMTKSGNTLDVGTAAASRIVVNADNIDLATSGVTADTYRSVTTDAYGRITGGTNPTTVSAYGLTDVYTKTEINTSLATKLNLTGGTMSGAIAMGTNKITGAGDPTAAQDVATKAYTDSILGSATSAATSAAAAATSASAASTSASGAATSATNAGNSATAAASSAAAAATTYDNFDDRYLGDKSSDPTVDNDGNALLTGALYFNTTSDAMKVYSGSAWAAVAPTATSINLASQVTGTLPVANGGTGATTLTANNVLLGNGTSAPQAVAPSTAGNVLTSNGSTWQSTAPAGGGLSVDFVASGAIGNGVTVALKTDGTVEAITATTLNPTVPVGSTQNFETAAAEYYAIAADPNNTNRWAIVYTDDIGNKYAYLKIITRSGTALTLSSASAITADISSVPIVAWDEQTSGTLLVCYNESGRKAKVCTVSGSAGSETFTYGSELNIGSNNFNLGKNSPKLSSLGTTGNYLLTYDRQASGYMYGIVLSVSGTAVTAGTETVITSRSLSGITLTSHAVDVTDSTKALAVWMDLAANDYIYAASLTISGTSISIAGGSSISGTTRYSTSLGLSATFGDSSGKYVVAGRDRTDNDGYAFVVTDSGGSYSSGTRVAFLVGTISDLALSNNSLTPNKFLVASKGVIATPNNAYINIGTISGTNITFNTASVIDSTNGANKFLEVAKQNDSLGHYMTTYRAYSDGTALATMGYVGGTSSNSADFIGITDAAISDTATGSVTVKGGVSTSVSSLTIGSDYYVQDDGTLSTTTSSVPAGKALSATSILLKGLS